MPPSRWNPPAMLAPLFILALVGCRAPDDQGTPPLHGARPTQGQPPVVAVTHANVSKAFAEALRAPVFYITTSATEAARLEQGLSEAASARANVGEAPLPARVMTFDSDAEAGAFVSMIERSNMALADAGLPEVVVVDLRSE